MDRHEKEQDVIVTSKSVHKSSQKENIPHQVSQ